MGTSRRLAAVLTALSVAAAACSSSVSGTPPIIYITPTPATTAVKFTPAATVPATATATVPATATAAPTSAPTPHLTPAPTPHLTPAPTPHLTLAPTPHLTLAPTPHLTLAPPIISFPPLYSHGMYLLWTKTVAGPNYTSTPQAWLVKPDGTGLRLAAQGSTVGPYSPPPVNLDVVWSHDGSTIHVIHWPQCLAMIYDQPVGGGTPTLRATMTIKDWHFVWSPTDGKISYWHFSGQDIVCEQNSVDDIHDLMLMTAGGTQKITVKAHVNYQVTEWVPDGSGAIARDDNSAWYRVNLYDGSAVALGVTASKLRISPDGTKIAWINNGTLYMRALSSVTVKNLGSAEDFAWRPDGGALALSSGTLKVVSATTYYTTTIYSFGTTSPSWSPDGTKIAFVKPSTYSVLVATVSTHAVVPVSGTYGATKVSWEP
jgi:hypothetical protein